jgi:hypothetical protein
MTCPYRKMSRFSQTARTQFEYNETPNADGDPDIVYLNLDIINNTTLDPQSAAQQDPQIRFNETRDAPIVKDASKYQFSIVRFVMNGANKDLPLFIPIVKTQTLLPPLPGVPLQNITEYEGAISFEQGWNTTNFPGGIVIRALPPIRPLIYIPETQNPVVAPLPRNPTLGQGQDLSTRYYWVYTYSHWVDLMNIWFDTLWNETFLAFQSAWAAAGTGDPFPYADFAAWQAVAGPAPQIEYDEISGLFTILACQKTFGDRLEAFVPPVGPGPIPQDPGTSRIFFDSNMFGLFSNFDNIFYGGPSSGIQGPFFPAPTPVGYVNEILIRNKKFQNILDLRPAQSPALAYPLQGPNQIPVPALQQDMFWKQTQDYESTSSLWSPVSSIVFTSTLLPVRTEAAGQPITFGSGNLGYSSAAIQNAFQPIITDIALDLANEGSDGYRKMIYYAPVAEYRMASMTPSRQPINSIDIQVFWKNRLDGNLYPLTMFNQSSVAIKCMFRRIRE